MHVGKTFEEKSRVLLRLSHISHPKNQSESSYELYPCSRTERQFFKKNLPVLIGIVEQLLALS